MSPQLAIVEWDDAHALAGNEERTLEDLEGVHRPYRFSTVGWILRQDEIGVTIAAEKTVEDDGTESFRGITFIPAGMVREVKPAKNSRQRQKDHSGSRKPKAAKEKGSASQTDDRGLVPPDRFVMVEIPPDPKSV